MEKFQALFISQHEKFKFSTTLERCIISTIEINQTLQRETQNQ